MVFTLGLPCQHLEAPITLLTFTSSGVRTRDSAQAQQGRENAFYRQAEPTGQVQSLCTLDFSKWRVKEVTVSN